MEQAAAAPSDRPRLAPPPSRASQLRRQWLDSALAKAGIDASHWDPTRGVEANRSTIEAVYTYYGLLYLSDPRLEWAGMANMIGPSFYAGFLDVGFLPDQMRRTFLRLRRCARWTVRRFTRRDREVEQRLVGDLGFFEETFLTMQRKIFEDQALMHEAFRGGGLAAIRALGDAGVIDAATVQAWEQIGSGDATAVHAGNRVLLYREQHDIIDRFYVDMRMHSPPLGRMFTYGLTLAGKPAVPGAKGYCDVFPFTLTAPLSRRLRLALRTPLAAGNLALFASRWRLIDTDTLPTYTRLISERVREARSLVKSSIAQRMLKFRLGRRLGWITLALLTHWRLGVEQAPTAAAGTRDAVVDLRTPPRESWILGDLQRREFELSVLLPGRRSFSCNAVLAALIGPTADAPPNRFTIKLTPMNLAEARRTLNRFARDWGIDADEIALWSQRAAAASTASHAYSTRVFPAAPISFVRLEIQVEHHLNDDTYVIDVLYSWDS